MKKVVAEKEGALALQAERRREARVQMARPVYVQPADPRDQHFEEVLTMKDYSRGGFYFISEREAYYQGMKLYVIPAFGCLNLEYIGEVLRVEPLPTGGQGVAVQLLRIRDLMGKACTPTMSAYQSFAMAARTPAQS
jgi:hypothetical protein